jgi:predicted SnoaL-like aldol condensation-catalyzing enzyme
MTRKDAYAAALQAWIGGDLAGLGSIYAHDAIVHTYLHGSLDASGRDGITAFFERFRRTFAATGVTFVHQIEEGDLLACVLELEVAYPPHRPTGFTMSAQTLIRFDADHIREQWFLPNVVRAFQDVQPEGNWLYV